jgi:hypothetical protein
MIPTVQFRSHVLPGPPDLTAETAPNRIEGRNGNDTLQGLGGNDVLIGGNGSDRAFGGVGIDICDAEAEFRCQV